MQDRTKKVLYCLACLFIAIKIVKIFALGPTKIKLINVKKISHQILYFIFDGYLFPNQGKKLLLGQRGSTGGGSRPS